MPSEYKDDWRYISMDVWRLDALTGGYTDFEDDLLEYIDNGRTTIIPDLGTPEHSLLVWIEEMFDERQAYIMKGYCWDGRSMATIGRELDITRVRVWQIYKEVLEIIKIRCDNDWEKYQQLFIGGRNSADGRRNNNNKGGQDNVESK